MLNKVQFIGRLVKDPELKLSSKGKSFANFTLAVNRASKGQDNDVDFPRITASGKLAELVSEYLYKGSLVYVECSFRTWTSQDEEGNTRYMSGMYLNNVEFLSKAKKKEENIDTEDEIEAIREFIEGDGSTFEEAENYPPF